MLRLGFELAIYVLQLVERLCVVVSAPEGVQPAQVISARERILEDLVSKLAWKTEERGTGGSRHFNDVKTFSEVGIV